MGPKRLLSPRPRVGFHSIPCCARARARGKVTEASILSLSSPKTQSVARKQFIKQYKRVFEKLFQIPNRSLQSLSWKPPNCRPRIADPMLLEICSFFPTSSSRLSWNVSPLATSDASLALAGRIRASSLSCCFC